MDKLSKSMTIDGVFASEHIDTSGEILDVAGCDITSLQDGSGVLNWEHRGESPTDILGKITSAKKIFGPKDCANEREKVYWDQVKVPFVYGTAQLFDGEGHSGAMAAAAIIRYYHNRKEPVLARFSIEGTTLERNGNVLKRSIARKIACTIKPCNRSAYSGLLFDDGAGLKQSEKEVSKGKFYETQLLIEDPTSKLAEAMDRLTELYAIQKAMDESGPMMLDHYSLNPNLETIDPKFHGTGVKDQAWRRKISYPENWVDRSYYYLAGTQPEGHFEGHHKYTAQLPADAKLYDIHTDPDKLLPAAAVGDDGGFLSRLEQHIKNKGYFGYRFPPVGGQPDNRVALFHPLKPSKMESPEAIQKAIAAGGMGAAPSQLTGGAALQREDISGVEYKKNRGRVLAAFRDWDRISPIRKFLKTRLPDASDNYIDRFAGLVDDYRVKKAEELFVDLEKALNLSASIKLFEDIAKAFENSVVPEDEAQPNQMDDGTYRVYKKDSPRQIARFHVQDGQFNSLEDHRKCFGAECQDGPVGDQHRAAIEQLEAAGHRVVREDQMDPQEPGAELYRIAVPESEDVIMVKLVGDKLMTLDGTEIPEGNLNAILDAVAEGELQMEPLEDQDTHRTGGDITDEHREHARKLQGLLDGQDAEAPVEKAELPKALEGGKAAGKTAKDFDPEQLASGVKVEAEHTTDPKVAEKIAMDHLSEDPAYYTKLAQIHKD